ncbi:MAG TPA: type II toxin-antitoxin system RelE/ParE family toxin [Thermomicrobiales bacterium]|jgi:phage-related protein
MRPVVFAGSSREDLRDFPTEARREAGFALETVQSGNKPDNAKPLRGFGGTGVQEIVADDEGGTFRVVYTVTLPDAVYVLHAFQKKAKRGIATPQRDLDLIRQRLRMARERSAKHVRASEERRP